MAFRLSPVEQSIGHRDCAWLPPRTISPRLGRLSQHRGMLIDEAGTPTTISAIRGRLVIPIALNNPGTNRLAALTSASFPPTPFGLRSSSVLDLSVYLEKKAFKKKFIKHRGMV